MNVIHGGGINEGKLEGCTMKQGVKILERTKENQRFIF